MSDRVCLHLSRERRLPNRSGAGLDRIPWHVMELSMPQSGSVTVLIVTERAEEAKLATISLRGFFPNCRVDAAYSPEEAFTLAANTAEAYQLVLLDDACLFGQHTGLIEELRRLIPAVRILLQSGQTDSASAIRAMQAGADYFLAKHSPGFIIELLFCAREALDARALRMKAERSDLRYQQLTNSLSDVCYELDPQGHFLSITSNVAALLGFDRDELLGRPYQTLFTLEDQAASRFRFNERRSGSRSTRHLLLRFRKKDHSLAPASSIVAEVNARGLYDARRAFLGTIGVIHDRTLEEQQRDTIRQLQAQLQQGEAWQGLAGRLHRLAQELRSPLSALSNDAQLLLQAAREARLVDRLQEFSERATAITGLGERLATAFVQPAEDEPIFGLRELLEQAVRAVQGGGITLAATSTLPTFFGDRERTLLFLEQLFRCARNHVRMMGRSHGLLVYLDGTGLNNPETPSLFPLSPSSHVEIRVIESDQPTDPSDTDVPSNAPDLLQLYELIEPLGGSLDISAPAQGPLSFTVKLPLALHELSPSIHQTAPSVTPDSSRQQEETLPSPATLATHPSPPVHERRAHSRVKTLLPARITLDGITWDGMAKDLSLGGGCLELTGQFPDIGRRDAYIVLKASAGILELSGTAFLRIDTGAARPPGVEEARLILLFHAPPEMEGAILASLIDAVREQTLSLSIEALLVSTADAATDQTVPPDPAEQDRRESIRVAVSLPSRLEWGERPDAITRLVARTVDVSRDGACLIVDAAPLQFQGSVLLHFAPAESFSHVGAHEPGAPASALPALILWSRPEYAQPDGAPRPESPSKTRIGIRFQSLTPYAEREVTRLLRQHLASQTARTHEDTASIISVPRECRNAKSQTISIVDDHTRQPIHPDAPIVVIAPGYGQAASDYTAFSYFLTHYGLRVLRYDHTNHVGMSEGELQHTTVRGMQTDLAKLLEFVHHTWPAAPVIVLATDVAARAAMKLATQVPSLALWLLVNPVIDIGALLLAVHGHDLVADYRYGVRRGITNVLGLNINLDQFVGDLVAGRFTDLTSSLEDIRLLRAPLCLVTHPRSSEQALAPTDLPHSFLTSLSTQTRMVNIPTPLTNQELQPDAPAPAAFRLVLELIASGLGRRLPDELIPLQEVRDWTRQRRIERERTKLQYNVSHISRDALSLAHLQHLPELGNLQEYRKLLDDLHHLLGPITPEMRFVDAGVGQGDLTRALLIREISRTKQTSGSHGQPPLLVGIGRSSDMLKKARQQVRSFQRELAAASGGTWPSGLDPHLEWIQADGAVALPFDDASVHRLVCNFSLSFVASPSHTVREWSRVLHAEGRIVFTAFLPETDFAPLYRQHLRRANQDEFGTQPQTTLHYFGRLREAIRHGILHSFDHAALSLLLKQSSRLPFRIIPFMNGQAWAVVVGKQNSSSSTS